MALPLCWATHFQGGITIAPRTARSSAPTTAEASAWVDVLVRHRLLQAAVLGPTGRWLVQHQRDGPAFVLAGAADVVEPAATIQHRIRTPRPSTR
ncbi:hypothetical protein [Streptomyces pristinaespiralis]|uniref:hypothetical protein n=1 Tax=Streptomyces pristinaespiralis TaxID=38300 RepID=UPI003832D20C